MELHSLLNTLNGIVAGIPTEARSLAVETIASAFAVSPVMSGIKRKLDIEDPKRREKIMVVLVIAGSMLASVGLYLRSTPEFAPWFIAVHGMLIFACTQPVYYLFIKPLFRKLGTSLAVQIQKAKNLNEARSAIVPAEGLGINTAHEDFR